MEYLGTEKDINKIQPVVTVCITTYNHAAFIAECLDSVLMQETDFPFEIILGEDDSTDGTREICKAYAEKHPDKIRLFLREEKDKIYINGRKTGRFNFIENLKAARGEYVALCEGDDFWTNPQKIRIQKELLDSEPSYSMSSHRFEILNEGSIKKMHVLVAKNKIPDNGKIDLNHFLKFKNIKTLSVLFRRKYVDNKLHYLLSAKPLHASGDYPLFAYLLLNGDCYAFPIVMGTYRLHFGGITNIKGRRFAESIYFYTKLLAVSFTPEKRIVLKKHLYQSLRRSIKKEGLYTIVKLLPKFVSVYKQGKKAVK